MAIQFTVNKKYETQDISGMAYVDTYYNRNEDAYLLDLTLQKKENSFLLEAVSLSENAFEIPTPMKKKADDIIHNSFASVVEEELEKLTQDIPNASDYPTESVETYILEKLKEPYKIKKSQLEDIKRCIFRYMDEAPEGLAERMLKNIKETLNDIPYTIQPFLARGLGYECKKLRYKVYMEWDDTKQEYNFLDRKPEGPCLEARFTFVLENPLMTIEYARQYNKKYGDIAK